MKAYVNGRRLRPIAGGVAAAIGTMTFHPAVAQSTGQPALQGERCQAAPLEKWTPQEKWVWRKVWVGEIADFNKQYWYVFYGGVLDPNEPEGWPENRVLTPQFLETILLHEPFRSAQTRRGVRIRGAWFKDKIDLEGGEIERKLWLDESRLDNGATLDDARTEVLSLRGSVVGGVLSMARAETGALFMREGAKFQEVNLIGAKIGGQLDMSGSTFTGTLDMDSATVEGDLFMDNGANFQDVDLRSAKIAGQLSMNSSTFATTLNMNSATVEEDLFMAEGAKFQDVDLIAAKIGKVIDMRGSTFAGKLNMNSATVEEDLFMAEGAKFHEVILIGARIGDQLDMSRSTIAETLHMDSATVGGDLFLIGADLTQAPLNGRRLSVGGSLDLRTARVSTIDLSGAKIGGRLDMIRSTFVGTLSMVRAETGDLFMGGAKFQEVDLRGAKIGKDIGMDGSTFAGKLDMNSVRVGGNLFMRKVPEFQDVDLRGAKIGSQLSMIGSTFAGTLDMSGATVEGDLLMHEKAKFQKVSLLGAKIGDQLTMDGSRFAGTLDMNGVTVGGNLFMRKVPEFQDVYLRGAKIAGQLDMHDSTFAGTLDMRSATVGGRLFLHGADLTQARLDGRRLSVGGNLNLSTAKVRRIDLPGATVVGGLWLIEPVWESGSVLDLRDAKVGRLAARVGDSSPASTMLGGFIYDALGSTESRTDESDPAVDAADFVERWLRKEEVHSPQAHEQFAAVLRQMGFPGRASRVLYQGKNHELWQELRRGHLPQAGGLFVLWAMIGYGYRVWYALVWIAVLVAVGWRIARKSGRKIPDTGEPLGFWYSLDRLLPIMVLRKHHYEIDLPPRSRVYFYFHMVMGYVLAMFLLAGLSGLVG